MEYFVKGSFDNLRVADPAVFYLAALPPVESLHVACLKSDTLPEEILKMRTVMSMDATSLRDPAAGRAGVIRAGGWMGIGPG
jgi:hypothetical protein